MTYGTIELDRDNRQWKIQTEPHVSMRLKRVFGKIEKGSTGIHCLSDTLENARDLRWFIQRYPLAIPNEENLNYLTARAIQHRDRVSLVDQIVAGNYQAPDFDLAIPPREYQKTAAAMLLARGGLLLADDVGLGKTASGICIFADRRTLPAVVVTMTHLTRQWSDEIRRFAPRLNPHIVKVGTPYDMTAKHRTRYQGTYVSTFPDVVVINYHKLSGWAEHLVKAGIRSVIFDEGQELRKSDTAKYTAARYLAENVQFRLALTATPIYNYGGEIYTVLDCIVPGELGSAEEFGSEWCEGSSGEKAKIKDPKAFGAYLRESGIMLRRTRKDVGRELPAAQIVPQIVESDSQTLERVSGSCAELARLILNSGKESMKGERMRASEELSTILRQATGIAKAPYVAEFVRLILESGEKVVLFAWHRTVFAILMERLKEFNPVLYTGTESSAQKEESKKRFVDGDSKIMMISIRSGAGLDGLQHVCRIVCFAELDWSPGVHEQALGRVLRDGQQDSVLAYYLVSEEGSDPTVSQVLGVKRQQIEGIRRRADEEELIEQLQTDGGHIKRLAEAYLNKGKESLA